MSKKTFTTAEYKILGYGLNFIPSKRIFIKNDVLKDIDAFSRKVKLRAHFEITDESRPELEKKFYATNKSWEPSKTHRTVSTFLEKFEKEAVLALDKSKPYPKTNLTTNEQQALDRLSQRTDIIICRADKGGATVIIDVEDYIVEANRQLDDADFYRKLDSDPTQTHLDLVNNAIDSLERQKHLDKKNLQRALNRPKPEHHSFIFYRRFINQEILDDQWSAQSTAILQRFRNSSTIIYSPWCRKRNLM